MPTITEIQTLLEETKCYAALGVGDVTTLAKLGLLSNIASGGDVPVVIRPDAPVAAAATFVDYDDFKANWSAVTGSTTYFLDVATDVGFSSLVPGFNNLNVGNVLTYAVTGLSASTTYYYRVRSYDGVASSLNSNAITTATSIIPTSITGLEYWMRSDQGCYTDAGKTTLCTNLDFVYTWDNMGNTGSTPDFIQATLGSRPGYRTFSYPLPYPKLRCSSSLMVAAMAAHAQPFTMVAVGLYRGVTGVNEILLSNFSGGIVILQAPAGPPDAPLVFAGTSTQSVTKWNSVAGYAIFCVNGANSYFSCNGVSQAIANSGANTFDNLGLHLAGYNGGLPWVGDVFEVMFFNKDLSVAEKANLNAYLTARYLGVALTTDNFESYAADADLQDLNAGTGWGGRYNSRTAFYIVFDTMETYAAGADLNGLNAGTLWLSGYVSR